jgi:imidazole glycerol-phosphate synthase subunit HisH
MTVGILDYGLGNIRSVEKALLKISHKPKIIKTPEELESCEAMIIPGVGTYKEAMSLLEKKRFVEAIITFANEGKVLIGICLGMQILSDRGVESGLTNGLGLISGEVEKIEQVDNRKVPHLGWNEVSITGNHASLEGSNKKDFYFIHSFHFKVDTSENVLATTNYDGEILVAAVNKGNIYGFQFHPEKSQKAGLSLLNKVLSA